MKRGLLPFLLAAVLCVPAAAAKKAASRKAAPPPAPVIPLHPPRVSTEPITFVWPPEGAVLSAESEFVFGSVADPRALFRINGATVVPHKDGGFLAFLPIAPGTFTFHAELALSSGVATADRRIFVPPAPAPLPDDRLAIDSASLSPRAELALRPGDWWAARMKATRGKPARARVGRGSWKDMREVNTRLGLYEALFEIAPGEKFDPAEVEYEIGSGWPAERVKGTARVGASGRSLGVVTAKAGAAGFINAKTGPNEGFLIFPQPGARMLATGRDGDALRVELSPSLSGWVEARDVDLSTTAAPPRAETGAIAVAESGSGATLRLSLSERVPFDLFASDSLDELTLRVFSAVGHTNLVTIDGHDFVDQVRWRQEETGVVAFRVRLKPGRRLWGWSAHYEGGGTLRVDLRRPPVVHPKKPLADWKIMLDPGHMPSAPGAIGPLGTKEMDANYAIAQAAAAKLLREGAIPLLTRGTTTDEVSLVDRPRQAFDRGADVFVSLHNNALPDGTNPFAKPRGFTVFYYHPQSLALGRAVHAAYASRVGVPDEGLQWDNLLVARLTSAPAILIENAYMILPEQEALLNEPSFREKLADALVAGLKAFALEAGERRKP